jgi:putative membrane protein
MAAYPRMMSMFKTHDRPAAVIVALTLFILAPPPPAIAQQDQKQEFAQQAARSNSFEIQAAMLAIERGKDEPAKQFARDMVRDHTKAQADLESAAKNEGMRINPELGDENMKKLAALKAASDVDFDQAYLSTQITAHEDAVALFTAFAKDGPNGPIKNFATSTIGTLRTHTIRIHGLTDKK